jgi:TRAP-type uncharacterized transport system substrate-binding protein
MTRAGGVLAVLLMMVAGSARAVTPFSIVAGPQRSTDVAMATDLARVVAPDADIRLTVEPAQGSLAALTALGAASSGDLKLGVVQADVFGAMLARAERADVEAARIMRDVRVVAPLGRRELYFLVRADSPLQFIDQIRSARINVGPSGGSGAVTFGEVYRRLFGEPLPAATTSYLTNEDALVRLVTDKSVDVVAFVDGQPATLLAEMKPESRRFVRLLAFELAHPASAALVGSYPRTVIAASRYPHVLEQDVPALSVQALLVANDVQLRRTPGEAVRFAQALCRDLPELQSSGHPKWSEVRLALPDLMPGAFYQELTERELRACAESAASTPPAAGCTAQQRALGFCR